MESSIAGGSGARARGLRALRRLSPGSAPRAVAGERPPLAARSPEPRMASGRWEENAAEAPAFGMPKPALARLSRDAVAPAEPSWTS